MAPLTLSDSLPFAAPGISLDVDPNLDFDPTESTGIPEIEEQVSQVQGYYGQCRARTLLVFSESKDLEIAKSEWIATSFYWDFGEYRAETCKLCTHDVRYLYEIENVNNGIKIATGSKCIQEFEIATKEELAVIERKARNKRLRKEFKRAKELDAKFADFWGSMLRLLRKRKEGEKRLQLSPKQLSLLLWRAETHAISLDIKYIRIKAKKKEHQEQLEKLQDWQLNRMRHFMYKSQKKKYLPGYQEKSVPK